jgi:hypothetical protein
VVYYLKAEPVSKIIDWACYSEGRLTKTTLQIGLEYTAIPASWLKKLAPKAVPWARAGLDRDSMPVSPREASLLSIPFSRYGESANRMPRVTAATQGMMAFVLTSLALLS